MRRSSRLAGAAAAIALLISGVPAGAGAETTTSSQAEVKDAQPPLITFSISELETNIEASLT